MNSFFKAGYVRSANAAQWEQVIDAYSTIVTVAVDEPSRWSGKGPGAIKSAGWTSWACAQVRKDGCRPIGISVKPDAASEGAQLKKIRRVMLKPNLRRRTPNK
jgi:hypothetical protein